MAITGMITTGMAMTKHNGRKSYSSRVGPLATTIVAAATAALCIASAADRVTAISKYPGRAFFGGKASERIAKVAIANNDPQRALEEATRFVKTDPLDPAATATLGSALLLSQSYEDATRSFLVAGQLGWRDVTTQIFWLQTSLQLGDLNTAAQRLNALLRMGFTEGPTLDGLLKMEATAEGRQAIANIVIEQRPAWTDFIYTSASRLDGEAFSNRMALLTQIKADGTGGNCTLASPPISALRRAGRLHDAETMNAIACKSSGSAKIANGDFEANTPSPWSFTGASGLEASIRPAPAPLNGHALYISSSLSRTVHVATQPLALQPGAYQISWKSVTASDTPDDTVRLAIQCAGQPMALSAAGHASRGNLNHAMEITIPTQKCGSQRLVINKMAADGAQTGAWLDDITIEPVK